MKRVLLVEDCADVLTVVQLQLERYNTHDLEGFLATYAEDAEIFDLPGTASPSIRGATKMREVYGGLFKQVPNVHCRSAQRIVEGSFVIDQEVCSMGDDKPPMHAAAIYQVVNGKIRRVWFADPKTPAK